MLNKEIVKKVLIMVLVIAVLVPHYAVMGMEKNEQLPLEFIPKEMVCEDELLEEDFVESSMENDEKPTIQHYSLKVEVCKWTSFTTSMVLGSLGGFAGALAGMVVGSYLTAQCSRMMPR